MESSNATHPRLRRLRSRTQRIEDAQPSHPTTRAGGRRNNRHRNTIKRIMDLSLGLLLIALLLPVMLLIALAVKLDSRGPVLFRQRRLGLDMEPFVVLKFRTMSADSSPELHRRYIAELAGSQSNGNGAVNGNAAVNGNGNGSNGNGDLKKLTADPRVTRVGGFLRRTSLDELPQLFNVISGSMSLIGPRPSLEYELEHYRPSHYRRFKVRPGITGLWQVSGRNRLGFHEMLDLDVEYSENSTLATDLHILVRTPMAAIRHVA
jgi:lipopolysaccharide/colanic/teichoic acid biosynthesis glycosyltransferase